MLVVWNGTSLAPLSYRDWLWGQNTYVSSVALGNITGGNSLDIVTGGYYNDGSLNNAQVISWNSTTLSQNSLANWFTIGSTQIASVATGDSGLGNRIVATGQYFDNTRSVAQLTVLG